MDDNLDDNLDLDFSIDREATEGVRGGGDDIGKGVRGGGDDTGKDARGVDDRGGDDRGVVDSTTLNVSSADSSIKSAESPMKLESQWREFLPFSTVAP